MGPNAHAHDITFNQMWNQLGGGIDLSELASELETLRATLKDQATALIMIWQLVKLLLQKSRQREAMGQRHSNI